ncbi:M15 family metallopeptidase [Clostridium drakei]|uniref:D-alanyl-D-alanine carboxypeptidase n=1 Tax=Clostridium drakei TaxID=332101 RepID=A0A2U8DPH3_9CLOT|nr:M15 family metallopeptidase [Clostridium drakei]AWI04488.1 D-alanyl-D-alanine carboxypeptidase [Clostridium drakei]
MKNRFKNILVLIIIACGFWYIIQYEGLRLKGIDFNLKGNKFELNQKDKLVNKNNINASTGLILVNSEYGLDKNYEPKDLTIPSISFASGVNEEERHAAGIIIKPLEELVNTAKAEGIILIGNSGYRSYKSQKNTYSSRVKSEGEKLADAYVAKPGFSEHQTGLCIDITNKDRYFVKGTKEADWLAKNCYRFGFIIRYPYGKKNITGIEYEPWHIRYVGKEAAKYIYDNKITLEEYLEK